MDPVPYEISTRDVDEVLSAYEETGGGRWTEERRADARRHVMENVVILDETIRSAAEGPAEDARSDAQRAGPAGAAPGDRSPARRDMALAAIEDLLIRDGYLDVADDEQRVFPAVPGRSRGSAGA